MKLNKELLTKAKAAKTAEEIMALAKENGMELTEESAKAYFEQLNPKTGEVSDDELNNVAGGGCHNGDGRMITTVLNDCRHWLCKYDGESWMNARDGFGVSTSVCKKCASSAVCKNCKYCSYEKGLWLCNNPVNMK